MAFRDKVEINANTVLEITDSDISICALQNRGGYPCYVSAETGTVDAVKSSGVVIPPHGSDHSFDLANWFRDTSATRLYATFGNSSGTIWISHA